MHVNRGVWVLRSQNRTVVSPLPLASARPWGAKLTESTASVWPGMEAVHRATGRTRNTACGTYATRSTASTETCGARGESEAPVV